MRLGKQAERRLAGREIRRWLVVVPVVVPVVVLLVGASACSGGDADDDAATTTTAPAGDAVPAASPTARRLPLVADVVREFGGTMSSRTRSLVLPPTGRALLAFTVGDVHPRCARSAILRVRSRKLGGLDAAGAGSADAYVSLETGIAGLADGASLGQLVVAPGSPHVRSTAKGGDLTWDIATLLRWSAEHQTGSTVFVVAVLPAFDPAGHPLELGAMEGGHGATLSVDETDVCAS